MYELKSLKFSFDPYFFFWIPSSGSRVTTNRKGQGPIITQVNFFGGNYHTGQLFFGDYHTGQFFFGDYHTGQFFFWDCHA